MVARNHRKLVILVLFRYAEGTGAEKGEKFVGFASAYGGEATKELKAAGMDAKQMEPPEYRLQGTYEGGVTVALDDNDETEYEAIEVKSAEPVEGS
jgi:hypothetical protein